MGSEAAEETSRAHGSIYHRFTNHLFTANNYSYGIDTVTYGVAGSQATVISRDQGLY